MQALTKSLCEKIIHKVFTPLKLGTMTFKFPDGTRRVYGQETNTITAEIRLNRRREFFTKCLLYGDVGFGESYVDGDWDTEDITKVIEWMIYNVEHHPTLMADDTKNTPVNWFRIFNTLAHKLRDNTLIGSRKNISAHYDLGNDFFKTFLDSSMAYSSAYFTKPQQNLHEAQVAKFDIWCKKLRLKPTDHVLEIGSGWGGFSLYAAKNYGCKITAITISNEQYEYCKELFKKEGLADRIDVQFTDYRHIEGKFDKIISIEMIEAVGHKFFPVFFKQIHHLLKDDGLVGLQMILSPDHRYESFRKNVDWIQKHIFPGSLLPSMKALQAAIYKTGSLSVFDYEDISISYACTLKSWWEEFNRNRGKVESLGFDEPFVRKWNYYFSYCEAAFSMRNIAVAQVVLTRPNNYQLV
ncbi:MAG: cyclopropane-fatty-acyl-phospholipid synthase family protein [Candidatus Omnitrophota bacterium]